MLKSISKAEKDDTPKYITVHYADGREEQVNFGRDDQLAEKIFGALILQHATGGGTKKNFLTASRSYKVMFQGKEITVSSPQDVFIISRKTPKRNELSVSVRFFTQRILGQGTFGTVRELAEKKYHIKFDESNEPVAVQRKVHHEKAVKEVREGLVSIEQIIDELGTENRMFGEMHNQTERGDTRDEVYTDMESDPDRATARMVMAKFKGKTLDDLIVEPDMLMLERLEISLAFAQQVQKVHDGGYIIVDLKLENAMHSRQDHETRIIDTAFLPSGYNKSPALTIYTASPEAMRNHFQPREFQIPLDNSSDVFSLAVVMVGVITGERYDKYLDDKFREEEIKNPGLTMMDIEQNFCVGQYPQYDVQAFIKQIEENRKDIPKEFFALWYKMTDKDPTQRPTITEVTAMIRGVIVSAETSKDAEKALTALTEQREELDAAVAKEIKLQQELMQKVLSGDVDAKQPRIGKLINLKSKIDELKERTILMANSPLLSPDQQQVCQEEVQNLGQMSDNVNAILRDINEKKLQELTAQTELLRDKISEEVDKQDLLLAQLAEDVNAEQPTLDRLLDLKQQVDSLKERVDSFSKTHSLQEDQKESCNEMSKLLFNLTGIKGYIESIVQANAAADKEKLEKLGQKITDLHELYTQLLQKKGENFLSEEEREELLKCCMEIERLTIDNPAYKKINDSVLKMKLILNATDYNANFFQNKSNRSATYLNFLSKLKSFFAMINVKFPKFRDDVKAYEEKRDALKALKEVMVNEPKTMALT